MIFRAFPQSWVFVSRTPLAVYHFNGGSMLAADISCIKQVIIKG